MSIDNLPVEPWQGTFDLNEDMIITSGFGINNVSTRMLLDISQGTSFVYDPTAKNGDSRAEYDGGSTSVTGFLDYRPIDFAGYHVDNVMLLAVSTGWNSSQGNATIMKHIAKGDAQGVLGLGGWQYFAQGDGLVSTDTTIQGPLAELFNANASVP